MTLLADTTWLLAPPLCCCLPVYITTRAFLLLVGKNSHILTILRRGWTLAAGYYLMRSFPFFQGNSETRQMNDCVTCLDQMIASSASNPLSFLWRINGVTCGPQGSSEPRRVARDRVLPCRSMSSLSL